MRVCVCLYVYVCECEEWELLSGLDSFGGFGGLPDICPFLHGVLEGLGLVFVHLNIVHLLIGCDRGGRGLGKNRAESNMKRCKLLGKLLSDLLIMKCLTSINLPPYIHSNMKSLTW